MHLERPGLSRTRELDRAEPTADALLDLGQKVPVVERQDALRLGRVLAPGDAGAVAGERQDRERPAGQEVLDGMCTVRADVSNGCDNARLTIAPAASRSGERRPSAATSRGAAR
jgi:hypothetical protein